MKPTKFKSDVISKVLDVSSRCDRLGKIYFYVEYTFAEHEVYCRFENMSSVIDFIKSNF